MRRAVWLLVLGIAVGATGCGRLEHRFSYVDPPGTPFQVWLPEGSGAGAVVVDQDRVAVAWFGFSPSGGLRRQGVQGAQIAWASLTRDRGPCGPARVGDEVRGDLPSLRLQCILGFTSLWTTQAASGIGRPTSVALAFSAASTPTSVWGTKSGVWLVDGLETRMLIRGQARSVALRRIGKEDLVLTVVVRRNGAWRADVLRRVRGRWRRPSDASDSPPSLGEQSTGAFAARLEGLSVTGKTSLRAYRLALTPK